MSRLLAVILILLVPMISWAVPVFPPMDTPTFVAKTTDILIVRCINADVLGGGKNDGLTLVEVEVLVIIKGQRNTGKTRLGTIGQPMESGKRYLMASFGGSVFDTGFLAQSDQAVVELPADFDLKSLAGRTAVAQAQTVFDARRAQVEKLLHQLQHEKKTLDHTAPKPGADKLQGTWGVKKVEVMGTHDMAHEGSTDQKWAISKGTIMIHFKDGIKEEWTYELDPTTTPKSIDLKMTKGVKAGATAQGIYEVNDDKLRISFNGNGKRPSDFDGAALGTSRFGRILVLERVLGEKPK
jgi:uncharacterized protein (TIGR03067 family)